jgi:hypothetical protein
MLTSAQQPRTLNLPDRIALIVFAKPSFPHIRIRSNLNQSRTKQTMAGRDRVSVVIVVPTLSPLAIRRPSRTKASRVSETQ